MTSTPASRSARATTLAPRSWPSSPAFATITRILLMPASLAGRSGPTARSLAALTAVWSARSRSVHAGNAVFRADGAALRARGGEGNRRTRGGRRGAGHLGVRAQVDLHMTRCHVGTRRRRDAEQPGDLAGAGRRAGPVE